MSPFGKADALYPAVEHFSSDFEPAAAVLPIRAKRRHTIPESRRVIRMAQMRYLMADKIINDKIRCHNDPPIVINVVFC